MPLVWKYRQKFEESKASRDGDPEFEDGIDTLEFVFFVAVALVLRACLRKPSIISHLLAARLQQVEGKQPMQRAPLTYCQKFLLSRSLARSGVWRTSTLTHLRFRKYSRIIFLSMYRYRLDHKRVAMLRWPDCLVRALLIAPSSCDDLHAFSLVLLARWGRGGSSR
jgi:hypothetical protein